MPYPTMLNTFLTFALRRIAAPLALAAVVSTLAQTVAMLKAFRAQWAPGGAKVGLPPMRLPLSFPSPADRLT